MIGETVTVLTAGTTSDPYSGDTVESWDDPTSRSVEGVAVAPGGSSEPALVGREQVVTDYDLFFPADDPVTAQNRVVVRGVPCDVIGRPALWRSPYTGQDVGLVVHANIREG